MKVLFQRVSVLVLLLYNFSEVAKFTTAHYLYKIHSNLESVEKLTVDYANGRSGTYFQTRIADFLSSFNLFSKQSRSNKQKESK